MTSQALAELATFAARVCYTLWYATTNKKQDSRPTPRQAYYAAPDSFVKLVMRTLHPHLSQHIAPVALLFVQRYVARQTRGAPSPLPAPGSEARIWCVALSLAIKQHDDRAANARGWPPARVEEATRGGLSAMELAHMEREFLKGIDWQLRVTPEGYWGWLQRLKQFKQVMESVSPNSSRLPSPAPQSPPSEKKELPEAVVVGKPRQRKRSLMVASDVMAISNLVMAQSPPGWEQPPRKRSVGNIKTT